ncbi:helix-turn-helix domain-containing protein [Pedobacter nanyangensis]|uniref:helix-turn-helix domain-containing protein n=1 Tax=Pedobacter nanyangensis TaxID=1562389 RepID=UPI000DE3DCC5|nr:helix-turn-helix transcriptional regulator [Pedobacter nanyangensis]
MNEIAKRFTIQSYVDKNREKLDESLVSLRIMKEIDNFLDCKRLSNKDLALNLGYSESYISQLMSGVKNINTSFISKFEKQYSVKFNFKICLNDKENLFAKLDERKYFNINLNINMFNIDSKREHFSFKQNSQSMFEVTDIEYENL